MVQYANPNSDVSSTGSWSLVGASTFWEATDEGIDGGTPDNATTRAAIITSGASLGDRFRVGLETVDDPGTNNRTGHKLKVHANVRDASTPVGAPGSIGIRLYQGSTLIANSVPPGNPLSTGYNTLTLTLSVAEAEAITDYSDLEAEVRYVAIGTEEILNITTIEFECPDPFDHLAETNELEIDLPAPEVQVEVPGTTSELEIDLPASNLTVEDEPTTAELEIELPATERQVEFETGPGRAPRTEQLIDLPAVSLTIEDQAGIDMEIDLPASTRTVEFLATAVEMAIDLPATTFAVEVGPATSELEIDLPAPTLEVEFGATTAEQQIDFDTTTEIDFQALALELEIDLPPVTVEDIGGGGDVEISLTVLEMVLDLPETSIQIEVGAAVQELQIEPFGAFELDIPLSVLEAVIEILPAGFGGDVLLQLDVQEMVITTGEFRLVNGTTYYFQKERIHNKLVSLAQLGLFFPVEYGVESDMMGIDGLDTAAVNPKSIETNETLSRMGSAVRKRTDGRRDRISWTWELFLDFQEEVALEIFEKELLLQPPILPKNEAQGLQQVTLNLVDCGYSHPPEHEATSGTQAKLTFDAVLGPT